MNKEITEKIDRYISENKDAIIGDLRDLVEIPSVRGREEENAPFGIECDRVLEATAEKFEKSGFETRIADSRKYMLSEFGNGEKTVGILRTEMLCRLTVNGFSASRSN